MREGYIYLYYGDGKGKTTLAIGQGMRAVGNDLSVVMVQFLDYNHNKEYIPLKKLEPNFRAFRFEKQRDSLENAQVNEVKNEIGLAINFSRKILETGECDMLILDGITDAVEAGFITDKEVADLLDKRTSYMDVIITGNKKYEKIAEKADFIYSINIEKFSEDKM
ncbi:MAG: cob(I)yrinic acid a,c-diamide adenosyltransferase [Clostridia bacterium]|jgi:cob(I)alamin adenosyltransferase|nr:cob(I)yrinic acid a,c-diamide adenosyltransferase [Clostridia bacterium]